MSQTTDHYYKMATWLAVAETAISFVSSLPLLAFSSELIRVVMISLLTGVIITLLISMKYPWMRWVMLILTLFGILSFTNFQEVFTKPWWMIALQIVSFCINLAITVILFKVNPRVKQIPEAESIAQS